MEDTRKYVMELRVAEVRRVHERYVLLRLTREEPLPVILQRQEPSAASVLSCHTTGPARDDSASGRRQPAGPSPAGGASEAAA